MFQGNTGDELVAYEAQTGKRLWSAPTRTGTIAPPVSYSVNGEQYLAVVAGWGGSAALILGTEINPDSTMRNVSRVLAFKLHATLKLPESPPLPIPSAPPKEIGNEQQIAAGNSLFERNCSGCHGIKAVSGGVLPDLRHSAFIADEAAWSGILLGGALQDKGMVSFALVLSKEDAEAIRIYLIHRANESIK